MSRRTPGCNAKRWTTLRAMGDEQVLTPEEQLAFARDAFANGTDFTLAVEEEFALLDPESLELVNRYEDVRAGAAGTPLDEHLAGELIASEIEVKTGRCETISSPARCSSSGELIASEIEVKTGRCETIRDRKSTRLNSSH